jgi:hypothetical protein
MFPGKMPQGLVVSHPVSHLDVLATIMDYLGVSELDTSDGASLRRFIETNRINTECEERFAVVEWDPRSASEQPSVEQSSTTTSYPLSGQLGSVPNFMIRQGDWKLIVPKNAKSKLPDMMFDLQNDPFEMNNILGTNAQSASDYIIGKAEYLKALLVEWMQRHDGKQHLYSDPIFNGGQGRGDITEVRLRRTWKRVDYWQSDQQVVFGGSPNADVTGNFTRSEYFYIGRTLPGQLNLTEIQIVGDNAQYFSANVDQAVIAKNDHIQIKLTFSAQQVIALTLPNATLLIAGDGIDNKLIPLLVTDSDYR